MLQNLAAKQQADFLAANFTPQQLVALHNAGAIDLNELSFWSSIGNAFNRAKDWTVEAVHKAIPVAKQIVSGASDALHIAGQVGQAAAPMVDSLAPSYSDSFNRGMGYIGQASHYTDQANSKINGHLIQLNGQTYFVPNDMNLVY